MYDSDARTIDFKIDKYRIGLSSPDGWKGDYDLFLNELQAKELRTGIATSDIQQMLTRLGSYSQKNIKIIAALNNKAVDLRKTKVEGGTTMDKLRVSCADMDAGLQLALSSYLKGVSYKIPNEIAKKYEILAIAMQKLSNEPKVETQPPRTIEQVLKVEPDREQ